MASLCNRATVFSTQSKQWPHDTIVWSVFYAAHPSSNLVILGFQSESSVVAVAVAGCFYVLAVAVAGCFYVL
jgi:hypothetical protein